MAENLATVVHGHRIRHPGGPIQRPRAGKARGRGMLPSSAAECAGGLPVAAGAAIVEEVVDRARRAPGRCHEARLAVIDLSTNLPTVSRRIAARLAEQGIEFADAPVSGGEAGARSAGLAIMVGRIRDDLRALPSLPVGHREIGCPRRRGRRRRRREAREQHDRRLDLCRHRRGLRARRPRTGWTPARSTSAIRDGWAGSKVLDVSAERHRGADYTPGGTIDMLAEGPRLRAQPRDGEQGPHPHDRRRP